MNIDLSYLEEITGGDNEMMLEMLNLFIEDIPAQIQTINKCAEEKELELLRREAHKLKPTTQYVGLTELYEVVKKIELLGKAGTYTEEIPQQVEKLNEIYARAFPLLEEKKKEFE